MDKTMLEFLNNVTLLDFIWAVLFLIALIGIILTQKSKISKVLNKWRKNKNDEEDFKELVYSLKESVDKLSKTMVTYQDNRVHDREDSRRIQREIYDAINKQGDSIKELKDVTLQIQEKNSKTKRAEIKEKIERLYRECSPTKTCTDMAYETLRDLIEEYEEHGGSNSFVHSTVEPEMVTWARIPVIKGKN